ncbi:hypothetical protein [Aquimarina sp. 2201CG5-10]|uniref:hypothetical protein n=1 Tax=Aquimarina callyspongiae TaxID=3098150 RepID=UPI002AB429AA|nr:hypothetical protein [Aquimarina sp. 2201CG5-10]MDY8137007.1 hypothetical protein [Aquimarina sp. 2201CG5-10]
MINLLKSEGRILSKEELKSLNGGRAAIALHDCDDGKIHCTCNGAHSCVSSVQECWDAC